MQHFSNSASSSLSKRRSNRKLYPTYKSSPIKTSINYVDTSNANTTTDFSTNNRITISKTRNKLCLRHPQPISIKSLKTEASSFILSTDPPYHTPNDRATPIRTSAPSPCDPETTVPSAGNDARPDGKPWPMKGEGIVDKGSHLHVHRVLASRRGVKVGRS